MCFMGHKIEPRYMFCSSAHDMGVCLRCPVEGCVYRTKPVRKEFEDLVKSEIDRHMLESHYEVRKSMHKFVTMEISL